MKTLSIVFISALLLAACGKSSSDEGKGAAGKTEAKPQEKAAKESGDKPAKDDRGAASVKLGDKTWEAERAKAKLKNDTLTIEASRTDIADKQVSRQQLTLILPDYKGPGSYKVRGMGSMFLGVGVDTDAVKKAAGDDNAAEAATNAADEASMIPLMQAEATVESDDGNEIVGTFSQPALGKQYPALEDGKFRAIVKK